MYIRHFKPLPSFSGCTGRFESTLVANHEDRFSRDEANLFSYRTLRNMRIITGDLAVFLLMGTVVFEVSEGRTVCYSLAGGHGDTCFSNDPPFNNAAGYLPQSPEVVGTKFFLYNRNGDEQIYTDGLANSSYLQQRETKILVHGYRGSIDRWAIDTAALLLDLGDYNVIAVDWRSGAKKANYYKSAANTRLVGAQIGLLVNALEEIYQIPPSDVHIIGHSLGAQTAGYAGKSISGLGRISALDPAGPAFYNNDRRVRVSRRDAAFVDVLHTNGDTSLAGGFGLEDAVGNADFYVNGGKDQPGCDSNLCSHNRAVDLYMETIKQSCSFLSYPCKPGNRCILSKRRCISGDRGCARAGYFSLVDGASGPYYIDTSAEAPYC